MVNLEKLAANAPPEVKDVILGIISGLKNISPNTFYIQLTIMKKFRTYTYSVYNLWVLHFQGAEWCMNQKDWGKYNRRILSNHPKSFWVWKPLIFPERKSVRRPDGTTIMKDGTTMRGFVPVRTWEYSQTEQIPGKPVIEFKEAIGDWPVVPMDKLKEAIKRIFKVEMIETKNQVGRYGRASEWNGEKKIYINTMYSYNDQMISTCHELAHILMEHTSKRGKSHTAREMEAEGIAAMVTQRIVGAMEETSLAYMHETQTHSSKDEVNIDFIKMIEVSCRISNFFEFFKKEKPTLQVK